MFGTELSWIPFAGWVGGLTPYVGQPYISEDKRQNSDVKRLSLALRNFLSDEKNQHELKVGVNMEGIRKIVYDLANYDSSKLKSLNT